MLTSGFLPCVGGIVLGIGYAATVPLGVAQAHTMAPGQQPLAGNTDPDNAAVNAKHIAKQAYRVATLSLVRFIATAAVLVGLGQATASPASNSVAQAGWATLGFVVGLMVSFGVLMVRSTTQGRRRPKP
ncbi:MAG: hypothetical protein QE263_00855 [Vampirovibrionales bacterium]|nr:hypothetical protein [Vampirovibrionales bacterium]